MTAPALEDQEWTSRLVVDWLAGLGASPDGPVALPVFPGPFIPKDPDHLAVVTMLPGAGTSLQGLGDIPGFQVLVRSYPMDPISAETAARRLDHLIRFAPTPVTIGAYRLLRAWRVGGAPAPIGGEDNDDCTTVTCHYLTEIMETQQ